MTKTKQISKHTKFFLVQFSVLFFFIALLEVFYWGARYPEKEANTFLNQLRYTYHKLLAKDLPVFNLVSVLQSGLILILCILFVQYIVTLSPKERESNRVVSNGRVKPIKYLLYFLLLLCHSGVLALFAINPVVFNILCLEDNFVETCSVLFFFSSCMILLVKLFRIKTRSANTKYQRIILGVFIFIFFLVGMEEISWFQRVLEVDASGVFLQNDQWETNIHNFNTALTENVYYFGSFTFFILLPFLFYFITLPQRFLFLDDFVPGKSIAIISTLIMAYNFEMWKTIFMQIAFFLTFVITVFFLMKNRESKMMFYVYLANALLLILIQALFLYYGSRQIRTWDISEYKEFFIAGSFFIYSLEIVFGLNKKFS